MDGQDDVKSEDSALLLGGSDEHLSSESDMPNDQTGRITVNLGLEIGRVRLPLSEWAQVGPGSVLMLSGVGVGEAYLTDAEGVVAYGELVDVAGVMGFKIKRWRGIS
ncbi:MULTISPECIES: FliM/FliN family flagellar motor switch protein [Vibrio]|uniref:FliM/FliN family flagellar motor switch protein n=1 Tax=Vibrio TaxID=662 RepID=UPI0001B953EC|nr:MULTISPECIES: FliM/FliN family flagellar motor switch protein [Vibrio]EEX34253.1 hypothetical protein VIC_001047 [Vibrio coralliilyticus ATCC BAA-450]MDE3898663.1 FliM/FliN family flagellar motor switch protein [Vibrio sp. CC007]